LESRGALCDVHDPFVPVVPLTREHPSLVGRRSVTLDPTTIADYDVVLIATDHDAIDYRKLTAAARLVIDTRNICERVGVIGPNVVKA
jgi:UDP-N-acetyl-D-glucosamine dehydrogenase